MLFNSISLKDREVFEKYVKDMENSSYNFTNMFMWAGNDNVTYAVTNDCLVLRYKFGKNPASVSYPVGQGDKQKAIFEIYKYFESSNMQMKFKAMTPDMVAELEGMFPGKFDFKFDRDNSDYVYLVQELIELKGKKFHSKKNHLNQFVSNYNYSYEHYTKELADECKRAFSSWMNEKSDPDELTLARAATFKLIDNFDQLPVKGCVVRVDGKIAACSIGEQITPDMVLIHVEFANPEYKGIFNFINQQFLKNEWSQFKYVNREEDMGLPGLRRAKESYRPVRLVEKYDAILKPGVKL
ncbi:MAG TPA: DUF2156 domain-containing protein [Clostridiales bacterium]|nr:DUF2156 domain-containing protein [Clostridiales bacterium]